MNKLTSEQAAILGAFTGTLCGPVWDFIEYASKVMGRPVYTHELASAAFEAALREAARADFIAICATQGETENRG